MQPPPSEPRFGPLRRERPAPWWVWALATLVHVPILTFMLVKVWEHTTEGWRLRDLGEVAAPRASAPVAFSIPTRRTAAPERDRVVRPAPPTPRIPDVGAARPQVRPPVADRNPGSQGFPVIDPAAPTTGGASTAPVVVGVTPSTLPSIAPAYGTGILWGHHPRATAEELAQRVLGMSAGARMDSLTTARLQQWVDSMAAEADASRPANLVTTIGGKKVGVDSKWIYLGPIRIPAVLLAMIPLNIQANPNQAEFNRRLNAMKEDLYFAAQRSQNFAEFRSAVNQLRAEKQAEKDFKANQRGGGPMPEHPPL